MCREVQRTVFPANSNIIIWCSSVLVLLPRVGGGHNVPPPSEYFASTRCQSYSTAYIPVRYSGSQLTTPCWHFEEERRPQKAPLTAGTLCACTCLKLSFKVRQPLLENIEGPSCSVSCRGVLGRHTALAGVERIPKPCCCNIVDFVRDTCVYEEGTPHGVIAVSGTHDI